MPFGPGLSAHISGRKLPPIPLLSLSPPRAGARSALRLANRLRRSRPCGRVLDRSASGTRCPLRSGNRVLAALRAAPLPGPPLRRSRGLRSRPRTRSGWRRLGGENYATPTCCLIVPHVLPPPTLRVLRCAPARGGSARRRAGATVAQAQPPLRPAQARTQAPIGPCARTIAPTRRQAPPTPRGCGARACPKETSRRGSAPNVKPIARRST